MARMFEGQCLCGASIYAEVEEEIKCQSCGFVFLYDKRLKRKMQKGYCSNCGVLLFGSKSEALTASRTEVSPNL